MARTRSLQALKDSHAAATVRGQKRSFQWCLLSTALSGKRRHGEVKSPRVIVTPPSSRFEDIDLQTNQLGCQLSELIVVLLGPAELNDDVLALHVARGHEGPTERVSNKGRMV